MRLFRRSSALSLKSKHRRFRELLIQPLEHRVVFDGSAVLQFGTVRVVADNEPNEIVVSAEVEANLLRIRVDETLFEFPNSAVRHIHISKAAEVTTRS